MDSSELLSRQCDLLRRMANEEGVSNREFSEQERKIVSKLKKMGWCYFEVRSGPEDDDHPVAEEQPLPGRFRKSRISWPHEKGTQESVWFLSILGVEKLRQWEADLAKQKLEKEQSGWWYWVRVRLDTITIAVVTSVFVVICSLLVEDVWTGLKETDPDPVGFELRAHELVWDRDCWAVAGDVVATGKTAPVMHVAISLEWEEIEPGIDNWVCVTLLEGKGKLNTRLPHFRDKEKKPVLKDEYYSWMRAKKREKGK